MNILYCIYKILKEIYKNTLACALLILLIFNVDLEAQNLPEIQIANQYFIKGEKEKALAAFQSLAKSQENIQLIHNNYLNLLLDLGRNTEAEDFAPLNQR